VDVAALLAELTACEATASTDCARAWSKAPLQELLTHVLDVHHVFLRRELPRLVALSGKVAAAHAERHPELVELRMLVDNMAGELELHMQKEERILFPLIQELGGAMRPRAFHCGSISNPIRVMELEHDDVAQALQRMRELTSGFAVPADGCMSYRVLLEGLMALEADLHAHVHEENNILFPRAEQLEQSLQEAQA
jgi:regulator of cell morphogenesis and NO signaling